MTPKEEISDRPPKCTLKKYFKKIKSKFLQIGQNTSFLKNVKSLLTGFSNPPLDESKEDLVYMLRLHVGP